MSNLTINPQPILTLTSKVVDSVANSLAQDAKVLAPGKSGKLKNSIGVNKLGPLKAQVIADVPYAIYVDEARYMTRPLLNLDLYLVRGRQQ